jgi:N-methylhydantoinase A
MLSTDLRYEAVRSHVGDRRRLDGASLRDIFGDLDVEATGRCDLVRRSRPDPPLGRDALRGAGLRDRRSPRRSRLGHRRRHGPRRRALHRRHKDLYTYDLPGEEVVFVNARAAAIGAVALSPEAEEWRPEARTGDGAPRETRRAFFGGWRDVPVFDFHALRVGQAILGPAIVEAETTTVVAGEGDRIAVNDRGWLDIALRASGRGKER